MKQPDDTKRIFLRRSFAGLGTLVLAACDRLSQSAWFPSVLGVHESVSSAVHHWVGGRDAMAQEFAEADLSPEFRSNGTATPANPTYEALARDSFRDWRLQVDGLVEQASSFSLEELRAMRSRTQITRHDCVEGWSAIGKWKGTPLSAVLERVRPKPDARFVVFYCADPMSEDGTNPYYESIDLADAYHPQTILAYELNGKTLPIPNGAPVRVRVERQLGYKMAKFIMRIELVASFAQIAGGRGGYWEDQGYQWYAGI